MRHLLLPMCVCLPLVACVQPYGPPTSAGGPPLATQDQTARTEEQDRISRFNLLAAQNSLSSPSVTETVLPAGSVDFMQGPVPVVRVVFPEKAFFAFDSDVPLPSSQPILDVIAENMKRDVPDAALTVLGHTDAIGTQSYNIDLSRRRAQAVIDELVARGVRPGQLTEIAIGKRQPIAPNDTANGRALNRRVEFIVSPAVSANLAAVQQVVVPASYLKVPPPKSAGSAKSAPVAAAPLRYAMVYGAKPTPISGRADIKGVKIAPLGGLELSPPAETIVTAAGASAVKLAPTMPVAPVHLAALEDVKLRQPDAMGSFGGAY